MTTSKGLIFGDIKLDDDGMFSGSNATDKQYCARNNKLLLCISFLVQSCWK